MSTKYKLSKRKDRPYWYITWTENNGRGVRRSTGTSDYERAKVVFAKFLLNIDNKDNNKQEPGQITISSLLNEYYTQHAQKLPSAEVTNYNIRNLLEFFGDSTVDRINFNIIKDYTQYRSTAKRKSSTIARELAVLTSALNFAVKKGRLDKVPFIERPPSSPPRERYLTRSEAAKLLCASDSLHLRTFIRIALYTGARSGAILDLTWDRVDLVNKLIYFKNPDKIERNKRRATVPIEGALLRALRWLKVSSTSNYVISYMGKKVASIKKSFKGACLKAELKNVSPHTLRHTAATWAAQNGATIFDIAGILGQSVVQITERYAKHQPEHLRSAVWSILRKRSPVGK